MQNSNKTLVYGVGINDADSVTIKEKVVNGKRHITWSCLFYKTWSHMLERCYSIRCQEKHPTYKGCTVCEEWLTFSNFKVWMESQDLQGKQLDKDILVEGNKIYSPETCVFVSPQLNCFMTDSAASRGYFPTGVTWDKNKNKFRSRCCNPFNGKREHIGYFTCQNQAHSAWRKRKHELACQYAYMQTNNRIGDALRSRFSE